MRCVYFSLALATAVPAVMAANAASAQETIEYTYDIHGRLVQMDHSGSVNAGRQTTYDYDLAHNRTALWRGIPVAWFEDDLGGDGHELVKVAVNRIRPDPRTDDPGPGPAADSADPLLDR